MTTSRKLSLVSATLAAMAAVCGLSTLPGASANIDPLKLAIVERGIMVRSVVATGTIEPVTKVEIKLKANGIIEKL